MANIFDITASPWRAFTKAFQDDLVQRVERNLDQHTALAALDLRPNCLSGKQHGKVYHPPGPTTAAGKSGVAQSGSPALPCQGGTHTSHRCAGAHPISSSAKSVATASVPTVNIGPGRARCCSGTDGTVADGVSVTAVAFVAPALSRLKEASGPGPSPDGVLSPVSPPTSRRSSMSASTMGPAQNDIRMTSDASSVLSELPATAAAPAGANKASSGRPDQRPAIAIHIHAQGSGRTPSCQTQSGASLSPAAEEAAQAGSESTAVAAPGAEPAPDPQALQRRPATLRLRCILRDPMTSSMLATARGHVDDADMPLRRPRGRVRPAPVRGGEGAAGDGRGAGCEEPGHLLLLEEQVLGRGAFGFVTLATDAISESPYALKRLRRSAVSPMHIMQEQQAMRLLMRDQYLAPGSAADLSEQHGQLRSPQAREEGLGVCSRCGGVTGAPPTADGSTPQESLTAASRPSSTGASGTQRVGSGRCAAAAAAAAAGLQPSRPCQCRFCTSGVAAVGARHQGGAAAGPMMGPARTAWLAKQQARGLLGPLPSPQQQHPPAQQAWAQRHRQQPAEQEEVMHRCCCRGRRGPSFCLRQLGTFQDEQYLYLLMEYCPGGDLDRLVRSVTRKTLVPRSSWLAQMLAGPAVAWRGMPEATVRFYAAGMLLALQELHSHFIVYRDLKPGNVLVDGNGYPRLADFGMAKALGGPTGRATSACGTLDFMAPEIVKLECEQLAQEGKAQGLENWVESGMLRKGAAGAAPGGGRKEQAEGRGRRRRADSGHGSYGLGVDWWSYGAVLYVLLTGCKPFCPPEAEEAGEDPARVLVRIINPWYEVPLPVYLSPHTKDLLRRLLVRQPKWRLGCGGMGAEEVRAHPFFAGFDWDAYEERRMAPPYPAKVVSLPQEQEVQSLACFFGFHGSSVPAASGQQHPPVPQQQQQQHPEGSEGQGPDARRRRLQQQQPANWLQDF